LFVELLRRPKIMKEQRAMRICPFGLFSVCLALCGTAGATPSTEAISKAVAAIIAVQFDIAVAQKKFSVMSRGMAETEKCAARELLGTSIDYREVTDEVIVVGKIISEMKTVDDQDSIRRHVGVVAHRVVAIGENDIQLVNDLMTSLTTPDATAAATVLRDKMIEVRDLLKPIANEKW
jgi:predicted RNA-binding Zn ribbon-like protein